MPPHGQGGHHHHGGGFAPPGHNHHHHGGGFAPPGHNHNHHNQGGFFPASHHHHSFPVDNHHHHHNHHRPISHWHRRHHGGLNGRIAIHRSHQHGCFCGCLSLIFVFISWLIWDVIFGLICCLLCCSCSSRKDEDEGLKEGMIGNSPQVVVGIPIPVTATQQPVYQIGVTPTGQPIYSGGVMMMNQAQQQYPSAPPGYYPPPQI